MSTTWLPEFIEPIRLADKGARLTGKIELSRMPRLGSSLCDTDGTVFIDLSFSKNKGGVRYINGVLKTELSVICQRCMEPMSLVISTEVNLELINSLAAAARMPHNYEPLLVNAEPISLVELIEDELILALPLSPLHPENECGAVGLVKDVTVHATPNPFAVLSKLKSSK
jgi:uncharacterized protein